MGSPLLTHLADHDAPCPVCSFNLRGISTPTCPECGSALELTIGAPNKKLAPFTLAIVALAMGLGFDGVILAIAGVALLIALAYGGTMPTDWEPYFIGGVFLFGSSACALAITALLKAQRRWFRFTPPTQWWLAVAIFIGVFLSHLGMGFLILVVLN